MLSVLTKSLNVFLPTLSMSVFGLAKNPTFCLKNSKLPKLSLEKPNFQIKVKMHEATQAWPDFC